MAVTCLKVLYSRLHGPEADYQSLITREELKSLFTPAIANLPILKGEEEEIIDEVKGIESRVSWLIRELESTGWITRTPDKVSGKSVYQLSRVGKQFTEVFYAHDFSGLKSRQRNVRNTRNALQVYAQGMDPYNLIDAYSYSQQVISDLSDEISELHMKKTELMQQAVEKSRLAFDQLTEYMDRHFIPDLSIRMSADSVERHRHHISKVIEEIREWPEDKLDSVDQRFRSLAPEYTDSISGNAVLYTLDSIENYITSACLIKMPELRKALSGFIKRSEIIIRQSSMLSAHQQGGILEFIQFYTEQKDSAQEELLRRIGDAIEPAAPQLLDPGDLALHESARKRIIENDIEITEPTREERLNAAIINALQSAFVVTGSAVRDEILNQMGDSPSLNIRNFQVHDALSLLIMSQAIEVASIANQGLEPRLAVESVLESGKPKRFQTPFGEYEEFIIRKMYEA